MSSFTATIDDPNRGANKAQAGVRAMSLVKCVVIGLLVLPPAELAGFILVAMSVGWLWAGLAFVGTSILGVALLKRMGRHELARLTGALRNDGLAALRLDSPGVATLLGAVLLILPGFITDAVGAALFLPPFRKWAASALARAAGAARKRDHGGRDRIIDLEPGEWHRIQDRKRARSRPAARRKPTRDQEGSS
jgi:UPF0716 protein FxsA